MSSRKEIERRVIGDRGSNSIVRNSRDSRDQESTIDFPKHKKKKKNERGSTFQPGKRHSLSVLRRVSRLLSLQEQK